MTARVGVLVLALCVALDVADAASLVNAGQHADEEISSDREKRQSFDLMVSFRKTREYFHTTFYVSEGSSLKRVTGI